VVVVVVVVCLGTEGKRWRRLIMIMQLIAYKRICSSGLVFVCFFVVDFRPYDYFLLLWLLLVTGSPFRFVSSSVCSFSSEHLQRFGKS